MAGYVVVRGQQETARTAGRIADRLARRRSHHLDHCLDERPRREVLPCTTLGVLRVLLQQPFVRIAFDVSVETRPTLPIDQIDDEAAQLGRVLDLVLRLAEDDPQHPRLPAQRFQDVPVLDLQRVAIQGDQVGQSNPAGIEEGWL